MVVLLYHVTFLLVTAMSWGIIPVAAGRKLEEDVRPCREAADWKTEEDPPFLERVGCKMSQTTQCHEPHPSD